MNRFSNTLKFLMQENGISTSALAKATNIPASTISEWTAGREPRLSDSLIKLARFFDVSLEFLITGEEPSQIQTNERTKESEDGFETILSGIYRIQVERYKGPKE